MKSVDQKAHEILTHGLSKLFLLNNCINSNVPTQSRTGD